MTANRSLQITTLALLAASLTFGCSRPREHWWQFWRRGEPAEYSDITIADPLGAPGALDADDLWGTETMPYEGSLDPDTFALEGGLPEPDAIRQDVDGIIMELLTVYFDYDSFNLTPEARTAVEEDAGWILDHGDLQIRLEGHCDERGTEEYNFNLGQRRAQAVREALVARGVEMDRLHTYSWGELRPIDVGTGESAWRRNRRVQFAVWSTD